MSNKKNFLCISIVLGIICLTILLLYCLKIIDKETAVHIYIPCSFMQSWLLISSSIKSLTTK